MRGLLIQEGIPRVLPIAIPKRLKFMAATFVKKGPSCKRRTNGTLPTPTKICNQNGSKHYRTFTKRSNCQIRGYSTLSTTNQLEALTLMSFMHHIHSFALVNYAFMILEAGKSKIGLPNTQFESVAKQELRRHAILGDSLIHFAVTLNLYLKRLEAVPIAQKRDLIVSDENLISTAKSEKCLPILNKIVFVDEIESFLPRTVLFDFSTMNPKGYASLFEALCGTMYRTKDSFNTAWEFLEYHGIVNGSPSLPETTPLSQPVTLLGHSFTSTLFDIVISHPSVDLVNFARLKLLGHSLLNFYVTLTLFQQLPKATGGDITLKRVKLLNYQRLNEFVSRYNIQDYIQTDDHAKKLIHHSLQTPTSSKQEGPTRILRDKLYALLAVVYLEKRSLELMIPFLDDLMKPLLRDLNCR